MTSIGTNSGITPTGPLIRAPYYMSPSNLNPKICPCNLPKQSYAVTTKIVAPKNAPKNLSIEHPSSEGVVKGVPDSCCAPFKSLLAFHISHGRTTKKQSRGYGNSHGG